MASTKLFEIEAHKRTVWVFLGYFLLVPLLISPVIALDPFLEEGGDGKTSMVFPILCSVIGSCLLFYQCRFSLRNIQIGDQIHVNYVMGTELVNWGDVRSVFVERRPSYVNGILVEVFKLNFELSGYPICIDVDPNDIASIIETVKTLAPDTCKVDEEIRSIEVGC